MAAAAEASGRPARRCAAAATNSVAASPRLASRPRTSDHAACAFLSSDITSCGASSIAQRASAVRASARSSGDVAAAATGASSARARSGLSGTDRDQGKLDPQPVGGRHGQRGRPPAPNTFQGRGGHGPPVPGRRSGVHRPTRRAQPVIAISGRLCHSEHVVRELPGQVRTLPPQRDRHGKDVGCLGRRGDPVRGGGPGSHRRQRDLPDLQRTDVVDSLRTGHSTAISRA